MKILIICLLLCRTVIAEVVPNPVSSDKRLVEMTFATKVPAKVRKILDAMEFQKSNSITLSLPNRAGKIPSN